MTRERQAATNARHQYVESRENPGTCAVCRLIPANGAHVEQDQAGDVRKLAAGDAETCT